MSSLTATTVSRQYRSFVDARYLTLNPLQAVGLSAIVPSSFAADADSATEQIERLWGQLFARLGVQPGSADWDFVGITTPADELVPPHRITYCAVVTEQSVSPLPRDREAFDLEAFDLTGGPYVIFTYEGPHDGLDEFYREVYLETLPTLQLRTREGQHLERYPTPRSPETMRAQAWIPIEPPVG